MKIISFFNHKGGVSKTTTTFNLGWKLASLGHKTLIVDADPQCNLTALVLDYNSVSDIEDFYKSNVGCDISSGLDPIMSGRLSGIEPGKPCVTSNSNLYLYCGNLSLSEMETQISVALTTSQAIPAIRNIPGSLGYLLRLTAEKHEFEYVLIDMSPSVGALNQCLLMSSDYFMVPTSPDFFCAQAIRSLANVIPRWNTEVEPFRGKGIDYQIPSIPPKFIGFISQRYRPRNDAPARSFQRWIDVIKETVNSDLIPSLAALNMVVDQEKFKGMCVGDEPYNLSNIPDFNSLIAQSQKHNVPVFALSDQQLEQAGFILKTMKESRDNFDLIFDKLANSLISLTN